MLFLIGLILLSAPTLRAQSAPDGQALFQQKCAACHTIGGGAVLGPDLKGVTARRDHEWLEHWIKEPDEMVAHGDPIAAQLLKENGNMPMPNMGLSQAEITAVLAYIETQSSGGSTPAPTAPVPMGDPGVGQALFSGAMPLQNGGTSCMACHSVAGVGRLGGGNMGPDLTHVYKRYGDTGLALALNTLPFPTMKPLFVGKPLTKTEQADLRAFFAQTNQQTVQTTPPVTRWIWGISGLGVLLLFGIMAVFRPRQHESLSEMLRRKA